MNTLIKDLRSKNGLTQQDLAVRLNTSQQQVQRLEKGERKLTYEWITRLAAALNVSPSIFFNSENNNSKYSQDPDGLLSYVSDSLPTTAPSFENGEDLVPVYGMGNRGAAFLSLNANFIQKKIPRPDILSGCKEGFVIEMYNTEMIPRYFPGERLGVCPHMRPAPLQDAVIIDREDRVYVRVFDREDEAGIHTHSYNPQKKETFDKDDIKDLCAITGRF